MCHFIVEEKDKGKRLLTFIKEKTAHATSSLRWLIEHHHCTVNKKVETFASYKVMTGDHVSLIQEESYSQEIVYEDDFFIVIDKPPFIPVEKLKMNYFLVHRLDRDTTGLFILAKTRSVQAAFEKAFKEREIEKEYLAVVQGEPRDAQGVIEKEMGKVASNLGSVTWGVVPKGLYARTDYTVEKTNGQYSTLRLFPKTGRTHQIRVHLKWLGTPIVGDLKYGSRRASTITRRPLLHAAALKFKHPIDGKEISLKAKLPNDFHV